MTRRRNGSWWSGVAWLGLVVSMFPLGCGADAVEDTGSGGNGQGGQGGGSGGQGGQGGQGGGEPTCTPTTETCDGMDNDCDSEVDEGCACQNGQTQFCYSGSAETKNVGKCADGSQTCDLTGTWGPCKGEVKPTTETCNGLDDDCNGQVDELPPKSCGVGACKVEVPGCQDGQIPVCTPNLPSLEKCDGIDNDCDQLVDETDAAAGKPCTAEGQGVCGTGVTVCKNAEIVCVATGMPMTESCDGIDNDCNGVVDDVLGTGGECSTGSPGICSSGKIACVGTFIGCLSLVPPEAETCNGIDDDCDGDVDDNNPGGGIVCDNMTGMGCPKGLTECKNGQITCKANAGTAEVCNGLDDDCDNIPDNPQGGWGTCNTGKLGPCAAGTNSCDGTKLTCVQNYQAAATDICGNNIDDNCNGTADENCCAHSPCVTGVALTNGCSSCVTTVCGIDSYCCSGNWDIFCVGEAQDYCGSTCP